MIVLHIENSYKTWSPFKMKYQILEHSISKYNLDNPDFYLNRSYISMFVEWWLHNIGYYLTIPFITDEKMLKINLRCKDVDLEKWG